MSSSNQWVSEFKDECSHFLNGQCTTLACMRKDEFGRTFAGCATFRAVKRIGELERNAKADADRIEMMRQALESITKGNGAYARDPHEFACNVIDNMKNIAREALDGTYEIE